VPQIGINKARMQAAGSSFTSMPKPSSPHPQLPESTGFHDDKPTSLLSNPR
jgi:hypothetical protein